LYGNRAKRQAVSTTPAPPPVTPVANLLLPPKDVIGITPTNNVTGQNFLLLQVRMLVQDRSEYSFSQVRKLFLTGQNIDSGQVRILIQDRSE